MPTIQLLCQTDYSALFDFEQRNWDYFTQFIPARPDSYRDYDSFCHAQDILLMEQKAGKIAFFVLYDERDKDKIIARVNLRDINALDARSASLGYRICESVAGKGVASDCVRQIIEQATAMQIAKLNAIVMKNNPASKRVLIKNGFTYSHTEKNAHDFNGIRLDFEHFSRIVAKS